MTVGQEMAVHSYMGIIVKIIEEECYETETLSV